jgi:hypothetical protein
MFAVIGFVDKGKYLKGIMRIIMWSYQSYLKIIVFKVGDMHCALFETNESHGMN